MFNQTENCPSIFKNSYDVMSPWPTNCQVYKTSNPCNQFEFSRDGKTIISCDIADMCMTVMDTPQCTKFYSGEDASSKDSK
jgi:hypothetical protein